MKGVGGNPTFGRGFFFRLDRRFLGAKKTSWGLAVGAVAGSVTQLLC